jgi:hypothetical protein
MAGLFDALGVHNPAEIGRRAGGTQRRVRHRRDIGQSGRLFPIADFSLSDISGRRATDANGKGC